ncbi:MAG: 3-hydroxybutyryl-CoA dehydrogenase, partial [Myxococcales bacterium]|nr:3-hydroxybutyryl-CoA dehydrogenase [Myxococcales bacterium]
MTIKKIGVVGVGTMGCGIVQVAAQAGYEVVLKDLSEDRNKRCMDNVAKGLGRLVQKEKISQGDADAAVKRIRNTMCMDDFGSADVVIEA